MLAPFFLCHKTPTGPTTEAKSFFRLSFPIALGDSNDAAIVGKSGNCEA